MNREEANQLKVTQLNDKMFRNHLEDCLSFGKPLLIENIEEELDPLLDPVLERRLVKKGKSWIIQVGTHAFACVCMSSTSAYIKFMCQVLHNGFQASPNMYI